MWEVLGGAGIGFALAFISQWFIGPIVEQRVRARERWEHFVIEMAEIVDGELQRAEDAMFKAWLQRSVALEVADRVGEQTDEEVKAHLENTITKAQRAYQDQHREWNASLNRPKWLCRRIIGDPKLASDELRDFNWHWLVYRTEVNRWGGYGSDGIPTEREEWDKTTKRRQDLADAIEVLSAGIGPPPHLIHRFAAYRRRRRTTKAHERV